MRKSVEVALHIWLLVAPFTVSAAKAALLSWNNLGMHCMDSDYSVISVLPPYNTIEAQLIVNGVLVKNGAGYTLTYEAVADPLGSFNSTAMGKGNFYQYAELLYGAAGLQPEHGLAGWSMPGTNNAPQPMLFEQTNRPAPGVATLVNWFRAEGIPISPYDDAGKKNPYPLMRVIARDGANVPLATNDIVLPVSDEMDCRLCHASGTEAAAQPAAGWAWSGLPERDCRLNILRRHDEREFALHRTVYRAALAARGFNSAGLYRTVTADARPVLCAACHASEALGTASFPSVPSLTASVHSFHAAVMDPLLNTTLGGSGNRAACYRCHPGSTTKCLRGAMGAAVAADGSMQMQCQSCHGNMSHVGDAARVGWFMEPDCQSCHTGTATQNNGQIRYTTVFETTGATRVAVNQTFATKPNTPAAGISLFRFSAGHGGLQCEACHGSTHAEFPSSHANDNLRNIALQGHAGVVAECTACHNTLPDTARGGPHGMHPLGQGWLDGSGEITKHADRVQAGGGPAACQACHGANYMGTVLSRAKGPRTLVANLESGTVTVRLFRNAGVGCYTCHNGPTSDNVNSSAAPTVADGAAVTTNDRAVAIPLTATGTGLRVVSQPAHGAVTLSGQTATYYPEPGFVGTDRFQFAAYNGQKNSNLGTITVTVTQGAFSFGVVATAPPSYPAGWPVPFAAFPNLTNHPGPVFYTWHFGDGTAAANGQYAQHRYSAAAAYHWQLVATVSGSSVTRSGTVVVGSPMSLRAAAGNHSIILTWPKTMADALLESTQDATAAGSWRWVTNSPEATQSTLSVTLPIQANQFYRLRAAW